MKLNSERKVQCKMQNGAFNSNDACVQPFTEYAVLKLIWHLRIMNLTSTCETVTQHNINCQNSYVYVQLTYNYTT